MSTILERANELGKLYSAFPAVESVVLGGSQASGSSLESSDIDLYVYSTESISIRSREQIAGKYSDSLEINNSFWEPGDEWLDSTLKISVDVMYRTPEWIQEKLDLILQHFQASVGYSTCFWYNVLNSQILFDGKGWFERLQKSVKIPYPEELRQAIVAKNYPILRNNHSSYRNQIQKAIDRKDVVSINHRIAAFLASYFDILFAINRIPHPGEKRLLTFAKQLCVLQPRNLGQVELLFSCDDQRIVDCVNALCEELDELLSREHLAD
jgi:predicted nucleotidyltransferase